MQGHQFLAEHTRQRERRIDDLQVNLTLDICVVDLQMLATFFQEELLCLDAFSRLVLSPSEVLHRRILNVLLLNQVRTALVRVLSLQRGVDILRQDDPDLVREELGPALAQVHRLTALRVDNARFEQNLPFQLRHLTFHALCRHLFTLPLLVEEELGMDEELGGTLRWANALPARVPARLEMPVIMRDVHQLLLRNLIVQPLLDCFHRFKGSASQGWMLLGRPLGGFPMLISLLEQGLRLANCWNLWHRRNALLLLQLEARLGDGTPVVDIDAVC